MSRIIKYWWRGVGGVDGQAGETEKGELEEKSMTRVRVSAELEDYRYQRKKQSRSGRFGIESYATGSLIKS